MTSMSSHLQGILNNPVSQAERTRRRVSRLETRLGKDAGVSDAQGVVEFDPNGVQNANEAYALDAPNPIYIKPMFAEFLKGTAIEDFIFENIGAGSFARTPDDTDGHYGIINVTQSGANTGALARPSTTSMANIKIWDGFIFECVFTVPNDTTSGIVIQIGFLDSITSATPTDGIYFQHLSNSGGTTFQVYSGGVQDVSESAPLNTNINTEYFKVHLEVQPGGDAMGYVSNRDGSVSVQTGTFDASTAIGLTASPMIKAYKTTAGSIDLVYFDYVACWSPFPVRW